MNWTDIVDLVRAELPEDSEAWFKDQQIIKLGSMRQTELANNIGGLGEDHYVFFEPNQVEGDVPFRLTYPDEVYRVVGTENRRLQPISGRPDIPNYPYGDPYQFFIIDGSSRQKKTLGVYPGAPSYTGTGTISSSGTSVTGTNTLFLTELSPGQKLVKGSDVRTIVTITSNTALTIDSAFTTPASGDDVVYGMRALIKGRFLPKEYALKFRYIGNATQATFIVTSTYLKITTTTGGTATPETFNFATYTTIPALKAAILSTSSLSGIEVQITEESYSTAELSLSPTDVVDIYQKWGTILETVQLDYAFVPLLVRGIVVSCRRRDQDAYQSRADMQEYNAMLVDLRRQHKCKIIATNSFDNSNGGPTGIRYPSTYTTGV